MARVAKSAPDGYSLAIWHIAQATAPALYDNLRYDPLEDFDHIGRITDVPMTLVSKTALPTNTVGELIQWMKTQNAKATYGHAGTGSASHLCALLLMNELGIQMTGVPFRGTGPAMNDLIGGQFDVMCDQTTGTTNQIKNGKIKGYAVTTLTKVSSLPDLPTLDQSGMKGFRSVRMARDVGAQGPAERRHRQARLGTSGRSEGPEGRRAFREPRNGACRSCACDACRSQIATGIRTDEMAHGHQSRRRERRVN